MKTIKTVWIVLLICVSLSSLCLAEAPTAGDAVADAQQHWEELAAAHQQELTAQESFAAQHVFDHIADTNEETDMVKAIRNAASLEDLRTVINGGYFSPKMVAVQPVPEVTEAAQAMLKAANLDVPPCFLVVEYPKSNLSGKEGAWYCLLGSHEEGAPFYQFYFAGESKQLEAFKLPHGDDPDEVTEPFMFF